MSEIAERVWETIIADIEVVQYDDGDVAIQQDTNREGSLGAGFVLNPKQVSKFVTRAELIKKESTPIDWTVGANCVGSKFVIKFDPNADDTAEYALGDGDDWLTITEDQLTRISDTLNRRAEPDPLAPPA